MSIETLENKVKKLNTEIEQFKEMQTNKEEIDGIKLELEEVKDQVDTCTELVDEFDGRVTIIEEKIPGIQQDITNISNKNSELDAKIEDVKKMIEEEEDEPEEIEMYDDSEIRGMIINAEQKIKTVKNEKADKKHTHVINDIEGLPALLEDIKNKPTGPVSVGGYTKGVRNIIAGSGISIDDSDPRNPIVTSTVSTSGLVPYTGATADLNLGTFDILSDTRRATTSAGVLIESANGTDIGLLGAGNTANVTWYGSHNFSTATQDTIAIFTGTGKTLGSAALATYPSLAELAYVKGVTSAIQTQLNAKITASSTDTLTNKRITPRVTSETSSATPTINTDNTDIHRITALAANITSVTTNLSGTPTHGQKLIVEITGTATRTITRGSSFEASTIALPTTTVSTTMLMVGFMRNSATSKWRCVATA